MSKIFFTSDTHFYHKGILRHGRRGDNNREFETVEEMNATLISNWNKRINSDDFVYHLGDFAFSGPTRAIDILQQLKGRKFLIKGNHDYDLCKKPEFQKYWEWIKDIYCLKVPIKNINPITGGERQAVQRIVLCHYAMRVWDQVHRGAWQLFGHSHGNLVPSDFLPQMDVGVDAVSNYGHEPLTPISFEEVSKILTSIKFKPVDHHGWGKNPNELLPT